MTPDIKYLDFLAKVQCGLMRVKMHHADHWDADRVLAFAKALAIRSSQIEDGKLEGEAKVEIERAMLRAQPRGGKAVLHACLSRMAVGALRQLSAKVDEWIDSIEKEEAA